MQYGISICILPIDVSIGISTVCCLVMYAMKKDDIHEWH